MRNTAKLVFATSFITLLVSGTLVASPAVAAGGAVPSGNTCKENPSDKVTKGGCVILDRKKGNCMACHWIKGAEEAGRQAGNVAPPLVGMKKRFPDKAKLRAQIATPEKMNPVTVMPPYERHKIINKDEIDAIVEFVMTL
jgi:L-cysteine S-thiosulfotransferase